MTTEPLILFGAFDRHNFGDLLLGEVAAALMTPRPTVFAGLAGRDLSACGGRNVRAITAVADEWGNRPANVLHVGGELLTCTLYQAAVMLLPDEEAKLAIGRYDACPPSGHAWAVDRLGMDQPVAYQVSRGLFRNPRFFGYMGVGGVDLAGQSGEMREQVISQLKRADFVWVRDRKTFRQLEEGQVRPLLAPDPAELAVRLFLPMIEAHSGVGAAKAILDRFPSGYIAVQFSAEYGDDATLKEIGQELWRIQEEQQLGIVLFRAGAAPWHDCPEVYRRLLESTPRLDAAVFDSLHLWDICALLAHGHGYIGSSLHCRIVAEASGRVAASLVNVTGDASKVGAYLQSWYPDASPTMAIPESLAAAFREARLRERERLRQAESRARRVMDAVEACRKGLEASELRG